MPLSRGCVTPQVLENIRDSIEGNYELVDGFDDLPEELQDKVKRGIEQGHVDNEDWLHVGIDMLFSFCLDKH